MERRGCAVAPAVAIVPVLPNLEDSMDSLQVGVRRLNSRLLFLFVALTVILSKLAWYDLRIYEGAENRADALNQMTIVWSLAQFALFVALFPVALRSVTRPVLVFAALVAPYFVIGLAVNGVSFNSIKDLVRYALPIGYALAFTWAATTFSARQVFATLAAVIAGLVALRLGLHLLVGDGRIRYGMHWEVFLLAAIVSFAIVRGGRTAWTAAIAGAIVTAVFAVGGSRALMLGSFLTAGLAPLVYAFVRFRSVLSPPAMTAIGAVMLVSLLAVSPWSPFAGGRLDVGQAISQTEVPTTVATDPNLPGAAVDELELARQQWSESIGDGDLSINSRIHEGIYFLTLMRQDPRTFWLGAGAGQFVTVDARGQERVVRGAHNTTVTLLYRHGIVLGTALVLFFALYGLRSHWVQMTRSDDALVQSLLLSLIVYRVAVMVLAQFHQAWFDDPLVWLSIAIAAVNPVNREARNAAKRSRAAV